MTIDDIFGLLALVGIIFFIIGGLYFAGVEWGNDFSWIRLGRNVLPFILTIFFLGLMIRLFGGTK